MQKSSSVAYSSNDAKVPVLEALFRQTDEREPEALKFDLYKNSRPRLPTVETYALWQAAFNFYNARLFQGKLQNCVITLKRGRPLGTFCPRAFQDRDGIPAHEISMNPTWFEASGDVGSLSIFVHEMTHQWREDLGKPNRKGGKGAGGYHDLQWAEKMEAIGLMPSKTGEPGGARTGFQMAHYIIEGGLFERVCAELLGSGHVVEWRDNRMNRPASPVVAAPAMAPAIAKNTRTRFVCGGCDLRAWSRSNAHLACTTCNLPLAAR
ncbi:sprT domain-containing protein [Mesorhizobium sp. J428]|uniref:sprT domain-containing protein n=1 Tax=Mesorhizobium sp. J428 TaxID=2898440 RepID=UPI002151C83C|nr:sprT domain-containing protein [Mesorhizobium sp. J428]MCR5858270.1 sprT domain-containing protein [Mesorhizobium sp. J428]